MLTIQHMPTCAIYARKHNQTDSIYSHTLTVSLIYVHSFHSTMIRSRKEPFFTHTHTQMSRYAQMYKISSHSLTQHTHTPDQRPCPGNLFQPICAAVRVGPIVSCVCNVSETVIGKSFETLKSLSLFGNHAFSTPLPLSLTVKFDSTIAQSLALFTSILPLPTYTLYIFSLPPSSLSPSFSLLRITLQSERVD